MPTLKLTQAANRERANVVFELLAEAYPDAACSLDFTNPLELLVATILAAQCTDARVNIVAKHLFKKYQGPEDYLAVEQEELEKDIQTCGFYRNKAKSIKKACASIVEKHGGQVPGTMEELVALDGVGRKTANVILGECFGGQGVIVDTHCGRIGKRLGFTKNTDPVKVERDLMKVWPSDRLTQFSHLMVFHGRAICLARGPRCSQCPVRNHCPFPDTREGKKIAK